MHIAYYFCFNAEKLLSEEKRLERLHHFWYFLMTL